MSPPPSSSMRVQKLQSVIWAVIVCSIATTDHAAAMPNTSRDHAASKTREFGALDVDYYNESCPALDTIVATTVAWNVHNNFASIPPLVRMFFHDCFVQGCDGSLLLESTSLNFAEKQSPPNAQVGSFDTIHDIKERVEDVCPGVVSCADIIALAAREAVAQSGGPFWKVELGRRDSLTSFGLLAFLELPFDMSSSQYLINKFGAKGLDVMDLVALLGAHTFGQVHCAQVTGRLYGWTNSSADGSDSRLDKAYAQRLQRECPETSSSTAKVSLDSRTPNSFDTQYYVNILSQRGLLYSDAGLMEDARTRGLVRLFARSRPSFFSSFVHAMIKLGRIGVLSASEGEIRRICSENNNL